MGSKLCCNNILHFLTGSAGYHRLTCIVATKCSVVCVALTHTHTHTHTQPFYGPLGFCPGHIQMSTLTQTQARQHPITQSFKGWMPFLPPHQQHQSTEGHVWCTYYSLYLAVLISKCVDCEMTADCRDAASGEPEASRWERRFDSSHQQTVKIVSNSNDAAADAATDEVANGDDTRRCKVCCHLSVWTLANGPCSAVNRTLYFDVPS